ncbi:MAG TPA: hypothetical protein VFO66_00045 [Gemmatimonadaceae bacterium]|nr:hypothetical protein [Gemmatimonadaceae bacterium]
MHELPKELRKAAQSYNEPPELSQADLDGMWSAIEGEAFEGRGTLAAGPAGTRRASRFTGLTTRLIALAATLVLGVAIGRMSARQPAASLEPARQVASADSLKVPEPYQSTTSRYLGQTAALLATLPMEVRAGRTDERFVGRAHDLLLTTRLLLDSPAAADPRIRTLLDDLELVLAQIVRLQTDQGSEELDLIRQALDSRDVLPRLRTAVADISADD